MHTNYENRGEHWELISKVVAGEANTQELSLFEKLHRSDTTFAKLFEQVSTDWELIAGYKPVYSSELDNAWQKQVERVVEFENRREKKAVKRIKLVPLLRYAASIAIVFALSFTGLKVYNYFQKDAATTMVTQSADTRKELLLPDGSAIVLNKGAEIAYPKAFGESMRKITLQGEAFFDVAHNADRPFVIQVANAEIEVLGTSFNVLCDDNKARVEVFVESGKVQLTPANQSEQKIILEPGFIGVVTEQESEKIVNTDENYLAWKTGNVIFRETPLIDVVSTLNKLYDAEIVLNKGIDSCKFTSTFKNQNLDVVLDVICTTFNLKMDKSEEKVLLSGAGC